MKTIKKITGLMALSCSLFTTTVLGHYEQAQTLNDLSMSSFFDDPATKYAFGHTRSHLYSKLFNARALDQAVTFYLHNQSLFDKFPGIGTDFVKAFIHTELVNRIVAELRNQEDDLDRHPAQALPATSVTMEPILSINEEDRVKDAIIARCFNNSKFAALIKKLSKALLSNNEFIALIYLIDVDEDSDRENLVQSSLLVALQTALKKNLTIAQLKSLEGFFNMVAFYVLIDNLDHFKNVFTANFTVNDTKLTTKFSTGLTDYLKTRVAGVDLLESTSPA